MSVRALAVASVAAFAFGVVDARADRHISDPVPGYTYFNRPGATAEQHRRDVETCFRYAMGMSSLGEPDYSSIESYHQTQMGMPSYSPLGGAIGSILMIEAEAERAAHVQEHAMRANQENCMVVRGWRVVQLNQNVGQRLARLEQPALAAWITPMISAEQPEGTVARSFSNEALHIRSEVAPTDAVSIPTSLSLQALPVDSFAYQPPYRPRGQISQVPQRTRADRDALRLRQEEDRERPRRFEEERKRSTEFLPPATTATVESVKTRDWSLIASDSSVIVVQVVGSRRNVGSVTLSLLEGNQATFLTAAIQLLPANDTETAENTMAFVIPPGIWRIDGFSPARGKVRFCLGAPSFNVAPGEVVFAGTFNFSRDEVVPDLALAPAQATLASAPNLTTRMRPAAYTNGSTSNCYDSPYFYAYEIPGAPFDANYHWGSQFSTAPQPTPAPAPAPN